MSLKKIQIKAGGGARAKDDVQANLDWIKSRLGAATFIEVASTNLGACAAEGSAGR